MPPCALSLPDQVAVRVLSGCPVVEMSLVPSADSVAEPGRPLLFLDKHGGALASGIADPENEVLRVLSWEAIETFDLSFFRSRVREALKLRQALGLADGRSAYRLLNGEGDGLSGFVADAFGPFVVLYVYSRGLLTLGRLVGQAILEILEPKGIVLKVRPKGGPQPGKIKQEVLGEEPPEKLIVHENGIPFEVHLLTGMNVG